MLKKIIHLSTPIIYFIIFSCKAPVEEIVYDYSLTDLNINSSTYGENIGSEKFKNNITLHYFGHQY